MKCEYITEHLYLIMDKLKYAYEMHTRFNESSSAISEIASLYELTPIEFYTLYVKEYSNDNYIDNVLAPLEYDKLEEVLKIILTYISVNKLVDASIMGKYKHWRPNSVVKFKYYSESDNLNHKKLYYDYILKFKNQKPLLYDEDDRDYIKYNDDIEQRPLQILYGGGFNLKLIIYLLIIVLVVVIIIRIIIYKIKNRQNMK